MYEIICNPSVPSGRNWKHPVMSVACVFHIELSGVVKCKVCSDDMISYQRILLSAVSACTTITVYI